MKITERLAIDTKPATKWFADGLGASQLKEYFNQSDEELFREMMMCKFDQNWDKYDTLNHELHNRMVDNSVEANSHNELMDALALSNLCQEITLPSSRHDVSVVKQPIATVIIGDVI